MHINPRRLFAAAAVSASLLTAFSSASWAAPDNPDAMKQEWMRHREQQVKIRLARMAERLEIKPSQQAAWQAYARVVESTLEHHVKEPEAGADAAAIMRFRADMAAEHAKDMAQIADATARLEAALTPDQRKTLDQIVQRFPHHGHHRPDRDHGRHGDGRPQ